MTTQSVGLAACMDRHPSGEQYGRHRIETRPWVPMVCARVAAGLTTDGLAEDRAAGLMSVAFAEMSADARGLMALGVRG